MESLHPLFVHFPIALLLTAAVVDLLAVLLRRPGWHRVALWNLALGTVAAGAAVWTGYRAADIAKHTFEIHQVIELHRKLGIATLILGAVVVTWRVLARDRMGRWARALTSVLIVGMAGTLAYGGYLGGRLVYEFGVGGRFGSPEPNADTAHSHHHAH